ncbi:hypothetical protein AB4Y72_16545 [Arthrobacter sp. YAF34]|uniref:hypothetical protein n=1 Tax=Arthrobacter sp. YAF34 TaxID=3233083 RepID=UPI003F9055CE
MYATIYPSADIQSAQQRLLFLESNPDLDDTHFASEGDIDDLIWLACVAILIDDDGLDGNAIVTRNQEHILTARAMGFHPKEIAEFGAMKEREA